MNQEHEILKEELNLDGLGVGDAAKELQCLDDRQIDLIHVFEVNHKLWEHGVDLDTRKWYVNEVRKVLLWLKNSLDRVDLKERIDKAGKRIRTFIREMDGMATGRLRTSSPNTEETSYSSPTRNSKVWRSHGTTTTWKEEWVKYLRE